MDQFFKHDFYKMFLTQISHSLLEGITGASGLTNMDCSIHKVVLDNGKLEDDTDQMIQKHQLYLPKRKKEKGKLPERQRSIWKEPLRTIVDLH